MKNHSSEIKHRRCFSLKKISRYIFKPCWCKRCKISNGPFTDDAEVISKTANQTFKNKGKKEIEKSFADYLALFDIVYHLNGQQTVDINGDQATGTSYCFVTLIGKGKMNQSGVHYKDTYVKQNGKWLIKKRESDFTFTSVNPYNTA